MLDLLQDVGTNVLASVVFWAGLGAVVALYGRRSKNRFRTFFGLSSRRSVVVCLSNAWVGRSDGTGETGYLIAHHELRASEAAANLFGSASFQVPDLVRGLVDSVYATRGRGYSFAITVGPSPSDADVGSYRGYAGNVLDANLIVIGGAARNRIRRLYLDARKVRCRLANEVMGAAANLASEGQRFVELCDQDGEWARNPAVTGRVAIIEKVVDTDRGISVFFCLGQRGDTTWLATEYLVRNWRSLERVHGERSFAECLQFPHSVVAGDDPYASRYVAPIVVATA